LAAAVLAAPVTVASAQAVETGPGPVDIERFGAEDRYATSLQMAEAFVDGAGGSIENVVMVSAKHWYDAVVSAPLAAALGAPVVMTPPDELRADTLAFLKQVNAKQVHVVSTGIGPHSNVSPQVHADLREAGFASLGTHGTDRYDTSVAISRRLFGIGGLTRFGRTAIIANGEVFADALVAGPVASKLRLPVLLTPRDELHPEVARYLQERDIAHVVLMGGTAALSEDVEAAIRELGITNIDRMAGKTRFDTATMTARYVAAKFATGTVDVDCFDGTRVGLARGDVPFDAFSAAPLLAQLCASLVLTNPKALPDVTAQFLDDARLTASPDPLGLSVFGGDAAVSQSALDAYLGIDREA